MPTAGNPKITVRLDRDTRARVVASAHNTGMTVAGLVADLLSWWLGDADEPPARPARSGQQPAE